MEGLLSQGNQPGSHLCGINKDKPPLGEQKKLQPNAKYGTAYLLPK